jgi:molybdate transport system regulatory protein
MKISARNCLTGTVACVKTGAVNTEVILNLKGGSSIASVITNSSAESLGLKEGKEAFAIIKASNVIICGDMQGVKISARNLLSGKVIKLVQGPVSAEVGVDVGNGTCLTAVITNESATNLGLTMGSTVSAMFKAPSVIIGVKE